MNSENFLDDDLDNMKSEIIKYFSFWKVFLFSFFLAMIICFIYFRYTNPVYNTNAKIEILDDAMDSDMALPTAMTIFNRSSINLENEVENIKSYTIFDRVISKLESNVKFYTEGRIKSTENHKSQWLNYLDFYLKIKIPNDSIKKVNTFIFNFQKDQLIVEHIFDNNKKSYISKNFNFLNHPTAPFEFNVSNVKDLDFLINSDSKFFIKVFPYELTVKTFIKDVNVSKIGRNSDLLNISLNNENYVIAQEFINTLIDEFNKDGIVDRQLIHKSTIDFVSSRFEFLKNELDQIERNKQAFKESSGLLDIESNAKSTTEQVLFYDNELFTAKSQLDLSKLLLKSSTVENIEYNYLPVNIGIDNDNINSLISSYNQVISKRNDILNSVGVNSYGLKSIEKEIISILNNVVLSIDNYIDLLELKINNLNLKESEIYNVFNSLPKNEKILREIEREQEIKEALFLLLLQKREEAAINYAVTKPSIKLIDKALTSLYPVSPNKPFILVLSSIISILIPFIILFLWFFLDNKIHTKKDVESVLNNIPIIGEIPFIPSKLKNILSSPKSRNILAESIRMTIANLNFITYKNKSNTLLVTSTIKGEGKTLVSVNLATSLSVNLKKVILVGADLRNPQIHKFLNVDKKTKGLADYIYTDDFDYKKLILKNENCDFLLSGTIPPNPTELLSSPKFKNLILELNKIYDYVIIDSAPCLLVSDTFSISKHVDTTLYVIRSNFTDKNLLEFIKECNNLKKLNGISLVLNGVGNSSSYGYQYGYQYGYNYGYGYGYGSDN